MDFVNGHEKLTAIFGHWPSFHDAEVLALGYERQRRVGPTILLAVHLWEMTPELDERGYFVLVKHTRATFRFHDCDEIAIDADEFNHQNVLQGLEISHDADFLPGRPVRVLFPSIFGLGGSLSCRRAEVVEAVPYKNDQAEGELRYV